MNISDGLMRASRIIQPSKWSLRTRLVYTTGLMLLAGAIVTLLTVSYALRQGAEKALYSRLNDFTQLVDLHQTETQISLAALVSGIAATDEITTAMERKNQLGLQITVTKIQDSIRLSTGRTPTPLQFFQPDGTPLFNSSSLSKIDTPEKLLSAMVDDTRQQVKSISGIDILPSGPVLRATVPAMDSGQLVGIVMATATFADLFQRLDKDSGYGLAILMNETPSDHNAESPLPDNGTATPTVAIALGTTDLENLKLNSLIKPGSFGKTSNLYYTYKKLYDYKNNEVGNIVYFLDGDIELEASYATIRMMTVLTIIGVLLISLTLYFNVKRIRDFLKQLSKVIVSSHANDFSEPFITDSVSCLDILECTDVQCSTHKNPGKVCYLETGDKAISPKLRKSCFHLKDFKSCDTCPVYRLRGGDELMETRHVVNTMMGLWGTFLSSVSIVLEEMYGKQQNSKPSLDDVALYLEQMAGLTSYSHDLQGVYSKTEVYNQLEWIFETLFGLTAFDLLEVNSSENRMEIVLEREDIRSSHLDVLFNCELCRAKRVAESINSEKNPHLCPYFGIDPLLEVRCCIPMVMGGRVGAVFTFVVAKDAWKMVKRNLGIMKKYLDETAPTLSSLRLLQISKEQALRDPLTLCHNRRFMDEYLVQLEGLHARNERRVGFIMADLDHFKMVNDEFGHLAGDEVLKQLAAILKQNIRKSDLLIRYGGEEFLIILMDTTGETAVMDIAEKLRMAVEEAKLALPSGATLKKTISMGVSEFPSDADQIYRTIKFADVALYQAKSQGRNRAIRFIPDMWEDESY